MKSIRKEQLYRMQFPKGCHFAVILDRFRLSNERSCVNVFMWDDGEISVSADEFFWDEELWGEP